MRRTKRFASFALAACMGASLLATGPVTKVSAAELEEIVTSEATETDAVAQGEDLSEEQEQVDAAAGSAGSGWWDDYYSEFDYEGTTTEDENGFVWSKEYPTVLIDYKGTAEKLVIPDTCTIIAGIIRNDAVKSLEIPASVEVIREGGCKYGTFWNEDGYFPFSQLQEIKVSPQNPVYSSPGNNVLINKKTNKLLKVTEKSTSVTIPSYITSIGSCAFYGCSGLTSVTIPSSVTSIGDGAFHGCSSLTSIRIPSGVTSIGAWEFCDCSSLTSIEIPSGVTSISEGEFYGCSSLTSVKIPSGQKNIPSYVFGGCSSLTSIEIPDGVTYIFGSAFKGCSGLKSIKIPASVEDINTSILDGGHAFAGCSGLEKIIVDSNNKRYNSNGGCNAIIETKRNKLILGCKNTKIPSNITSIGSCAFSGCSGLTNIKIPTGVTVIGTNAFYDCKGLTSIEIPASVTKIYVNDPSSYDYKPGSFYKSGLKTIYGTPGSYAETFAKENGYEFIDVANKPSTGDTENPGETSNVNVSYRTHVQSIGWQSPVQNGVMSGTSGKAKRLEGIEISVSGNKNLGIQYSTHCQTYGWLPWSANGEMNGTTGEAKRLEAIKIQLTGADKDKYDVYYRVHAQSYGWLGWAKNGEPSGTAGYAKRLEGIQIVVVKKDGKNTSKAPGLDYAGVSASKGVHDSRAYIAKTNGTITIPGSADSTNIMYKTHVQSFGWQNWVLNGTMSGTSGKAKRLEGINIKLSNAAYAGGIQYRTHVQTYGWEKEWRKDGAMSGTSGKAKRLEAIQIKLYGEMANHFDVYYRVHAQSYGWLGWAKNGEEAGTAGYAKRLEGIQIVLVPKGSAAPANNYKNIQSVNTKAYIKK